jgi:hypothetical protein
MAYTLKDDDDDDDDDDDNNNNNNDDDIPNRIEKPCPQSISLLQPILNRKFIIK